MHQTRVYWLRREICKLALGLHPLRAGLTFSSSSDAGVAASNSSSSDARLFSENVGYAGSAGLRLRRVGFSFSSPFSSFSASTHKLRSGRASCT